MRLSGNVKPISYLKARAPAILRDLEARGEPLIITRRGEAKAVIQDVASFEAMRDSVALLKILALAGRNVARGRVRPAKHAFAALRRRLAR
ncbi:MAG: type II toxin-antitoxin system Phd/YefM family antitoxin [Alphaproteobacteria bacterium]|nr:type II toxin-antitoxin system Phd/YefM family antitoxin [Alphaproteobacteria bacterium]